MEYYKINNDKIEKYIVDINKKEVKKIKDELLKNFSIVIHRKDILYGFPHILEEYIDRLKKDNKVKNIEYKDFLLQSEIYYEVNYDIFYTLYSIKKLIKLIDRLLCDDTSVLESIKNINLTEFDFDDLLKELNNATDSLNKLKYNIESNEEKYDLNKYKENIFCNINLTLVDTIDLEEVKRLKLFFDGNNFPKMSQKNTEIIRRLKLTEVIKL